MQADVQMEQMKRFHESILKRIIAANAGLELGPADTVIWVLPMAYHFIVSVILYIKFGLPAAIMETVFILCCSRVTCSSTALK